MPVLVVEPGKQKTTFTPTPTKKKMRSTGTPFEDAAVRTVELSADAFHEDARASMVNCNRYCRMSKYNGMLTEKNALARGEGSGHVLWLTQ